MHTYIHTHAQLQAKDTESVESGTQKKRTHDQSTEKCGI